ncbi:Fur family transcriptional regulator [Nostoc sp.]|uniref:Fur family transcriptional regulator n=1 Tax=Nostoc sp. TaxID=1180 RepID=UPI002FFA7DE4
MYTDNSLRAELNAKGYRQTPQRQLIFQVFQNLPAGNHLSADKVHLLLKEHIERMSLSTVYRNLKIMAQMGILREVELAQKRKHYELNTTPRSHHHHIVCVQCHLEPFESYCQLPKQLGIGYARDIEVYPQVWLCVVAAINFNTTFNFNCGTNIVTT